MRRFALVGLLVSCARPAPYRSIAQPPPEPVTPAAAEPAHALRVAPDPSTLIEPALAWRPFWPLDRVGMRIAPYLPADHRASDPDELRRYHDGWKRFRDGDADRAIAILSTLGALAKDATLRAAAHRDELQLLAATYGPEIAAMWTQAPADYEVLAAEYARFGKREHALSLLATFPLGTGEGGCEHWLSRVRLTAAPLDAAELAIHAGSYGLTRCLGGIAAYLCETSAMWTLDDEACEHVRIGYASQRARLRRVLYFWGRLPGAGPETWLRLATVGVSAAPVRGWDRVVGDLLFNALATSTCAGSTLARVRDLAASAPRPVGAELARFSILTPDECRTLIGDSD
jgi:hypothetical protein